MGPTALPASSHNEMFLFLPGSSVAKALFHNFLQHNHRHIQRPWAASEILKTVLTASPGYKAFLLQAQPFLSQGLSLPPQPFTTTSPSAVGPAGAAPAACASQPGAEGKRDCKAGVRSVGQEISRFTRNESSGKNNNQCSHHMKRTGQSLHSLQSCAQPLSHSWLLSELLPRATTPYSQALSFFHGS